MEETRKSYCLHTTISTSNTDLASKWRPSAIMEAFQESASLNSDALGCGRFALLEKGIVWVILRAEVHMTRYPSMGDQVSILTFPKPARHGMYPRYFVVTDEKTGEQIGYASSMWTLIDLTSRKAVQSADVLATMPDNPECQPPLRGMPGMVKPLESAPETGIHLPEYTDLDANVHVNNVRYMDWCCNALGIPVMQEMEISDFTINYDQEIVPGQQIHTELRRLDDQFTFTGFEHAQSHFAISGNLRRRPV
ncbi:MAG: hypothetical protein IJ708_08880 [Clostridia bacterium]|nr:hypothetical protein [Clostridia bacterium]